MNTTPRSDPSATTLDSRAVGEIGEQYAVEHLERLGHIVLDRNWRAADGQPRGELDIVSRCPEDRIVFTEVKTRRGMHFGGPLAAVTDAKRGKIRMLTSVWLRENRPSCAGLRCDVIGIMVDDHGELRSLSHVPQAF